MGLYAGYQRLTRSDVARLRDALADGTEEDLVEEWAEVEEDRVADVDKLWYDLHVALTGSADQRVDEPLSYAVLGSEELVPEPWLALVDPDEVGRAAAALAAFDGSRIDDVLRPQLETLRAFYSRAAAEGESVLVSIG